MREKIPEITVKLEDTTYQTNHQEELKIARETLDEDMMEHASTYGWYGVLAVLLDEEMGLKKMELAVQEAKLYDEYKAELLKVSTKVTDTAVDAKVKQDEKFMTATVELIAAKRNKGIFDAIAKAFEHRREMLTNLGHKVRKEMEGEVVVNR